jgi:hypothetical protein
MAKIRQVTRVDGQDMDENEVNVCDQIWRIFAYLTIL